MTNERQLNYTADEINNLLEIVDTTTVPTKTSQLTNDSNFATETYVDNAVANSNGESSTTSAIQKNSVKYYGAKGDGTTDDTNAITQCFDYCTTNGLVMYFPNGKYILNQQLKKSKNYNRK